LLSVAALVTMALAACGGPVQAGAAATVGDQRITTTQLEELVARGLKDPSAQQNVGTDRPGFERIVLRRLIDHAILAKAAAAEQVSVTRGDALAARERIAAQVGGEEGLNTEALKAGISREDLEQTVSDVALRDALGDKLTADITVDDAALARAYQQNIGEFDKVRSAHILVAKQALANRLLGQVKADPSRFAALAAQHSTDPGSKAKGGDLGFLGRGVLDKTFEAAIFNNRPGSFVVVKTQFGFHVIQVIDRRTVSLQAARTDLRRGILSEQRNGLVQKRMQETAKELDVRVNPRFGSWDLEALDIVPPKDTVTSPSPRPVEAPAVQPGPVGP